MSQTIFVDVRDEHQGVTLASGVTSVLMGPYNLLRWPRKSFSVCNLTGGVTLSGVRVEINPDPAGSESEVASSNPGQALLPPNATLWAPLDATSFNTVSGTEVRTAQFTQTAKWWRLVAVNAAKSGQAITVSGYLYALSN